VHYLHQSMPKTELAALYVAADVMMVTPLRDGMNLVAKEYVACRHRDNGALVLSEFAGAADELKQAYMVNPYDINGMKAAILDAAAAPPRELTKRMKAMRKTVRGHDVSDWAEEFMGTLRDARPDHRKRLRPSKLLA
jgi:trehalose 6-phosphate synthase